MHDSVYESGSFFPSRYMMATLLLLLVTQPQKLSRCGVERGQP